MANQQQKSLNVLLIGDGCTDEYHWGTTTRISPEAPVPVFDVSSVTKKLGMAGNVLQNLQNLPINVDWDIGYSEIKKRFIDSKSNQQLIRVDEKLNSVDIDRHTTQTDYDAVLVSDYNKGYLSYEDIEAIIAKYDCPVFIDTKKIDLARLNGAILKINQVEYESAETYTDNMIVTYGGNKVVYKDKTYTPPKVEVHDVCGAGDTFFAALVYKYVETKDIDKAIDFAMIAAAITVQKIGVYAPTTGEIYET